MIGRYHSNIYDYQTEEKLFCLKNLVSKTIITAAKITLQITDNIEAN